MPKLKSLPFSNNGFSESPQITIESESTRKRVISRLARTDFACDRELVFPECGCIGTDWIEEIGEGDDWREVFHAEEGWFHFEGV